MRHDLFIIKEERLEGVLGESSPCGGLVTGEEGDVELSIDGEGTYMPKTRAASARGQEDVPDEPRPRHGIWEISGLDAPLKVEPDKKSLHQRLHYAGPEDSPVGQSQQGDECVIQDRPCQLRPFFPEGNDDGEAGNVTCFYNTDTEPFTVSGGPDLQLRATTGAGAAGYGLTLGSLDWKSDRIMIAPSVCLPVTQQVVRPGTEELKSHVADRSESAPLVKALNSSQSPETQCRVGAKEKRFFCRFCGKGFNFPKQVEIHQRVHTGEKPFSCTQCRMRFSHSGNLKRHQRVHTGEKPFSCTQCERRFSHLHQLKMHQRVHTGERPYSCTQCGKRFAERSYLRIHQQRNHTALFGIR